ncbi:hypothetical protein BH11PSE3_BH11PSE3_02770 [soil metagenome]
MPRLCTRRPIRLEIICPRGLICGLKESSMLDLLFLGGGVALLCLLIAYARLTHRL